MKLIFKFVSAKQKVIIYQKVIFISTYAIFIHQCNAYRTS